MKFGTRGNSSMYMGYLWPYSVQGHIDVIRSTYDFSENTITKTPFLEQITAEIDQTSPELSSEWSPQHYAWDL